MSVAVRLKLKTILLLSVHLYLVEKFNRVVTCVFVTADGLSTEM